MNSYQISFEESQAFAPIFLDYLSGNEKLRPFYQYEPNLAQFEAAIQARKQNPQGVSSSHRQALHEVLSRQYQNIPQAPQAQIDRLLDEKTFTVTTGHQLNLFTGPLYFIYKIVSTINLSERLNQAYPDYHFVPVYWMATEDHDFEEINHFHLFYQDYVWESQQKGAVGRFKTQEVAAIYEKIGEDLPWLKEAYLNAAHLAEATRRLVHHLFAEEGLIILDADEIALKSFLKPIIREELHKHLANELVNQASERLDQLGYKTQVFPREINFFYLKDDLRARIVREGNTYEVLNHDIHFSDAQMEALIEEHPEYFSPNVVMRPLYQEMILPNLAYLGGPGELAYWLQLKDVFEHYQVPYPILLPRNFALVLNKTNASKFEKLALAPIDLFKPSHVLKDEYIKAHTDGEIELEAEKAAIHETYQQVAQKANEVDQSLEGFVGAEENKALKSLENIEKRLKKSEENKQKNELNQLLSLKDKLFPDGKLQERHDNFLNFYINQPDFITELRKKFDPLSFQMNILIENP